MKPVLLVEGGVGKQIAMTGLFQEYAKCHDDGVIVVTPHDYIFWHLPGIEVYNTNQKKLYENIIKPNTFINVEPYFVPETYRENQSIIRSAAQILGMPNTFVQPKVRFSTYELNDAEEFASRKENKDGYIVYQPFGSSHGPHGDNTSRSMEIEFATKLAEEMSKKYKIYQVSAPHIPALPNCQTFTAETSARQIMAVSKKAAHIVTIDSFMNHVAPAIGKQAIVVWGSTSEKIFGYDSNINIRELPCPDFIPTRLFVNDPDLDEKNFYSNKFTYKTTKLILEKVM